MAEFGASSYRRFLRLDETSLDQVLITYSDALVRFAYSYIHNASIAEDIAAESIAVLLTCRKRFPDEAHMRAYLYKVARSKAVDHLRLYRYLTPLEDVEQVLGSGNPEDAFLEKERNRSIYLCMQELPEQYREILQLAYFDGFDVPQISKILQKSSKQVYNLLSRARASLKELLIKEGITHEDI